MLSGSVVSNFAISWAIACQALLCPWNSPGKNTGVGCLFLPDPRMEPVSLASPALAGRFFTASTTQKTQIKEYQNANNSESLVLNLDLQTLISNGLPVVLF